VAKRINSRAKGARAERAFAAFLRGLGISARRGQQFCGGAESPDVITDLNVHFEVKHVEKLNLDSAVKQAKADKPENKDWAVAHKKNGSEWLITCDAKLFVDLYKFAVEYNGF
jgi:Holliday junction resolvase